MTRTNTNEDFANSIKALQAKLDAGLNIMEELRTIKITADANDELESQVNTLKGTIIDLQSQRSKSKSSKKKSLTLGVKLKRLGKTKTELSSQLSEVNKYYDILLDSCPNDSPNGIYQIKLRGLEPFKVPCATSLPGWTVIQRRIDGSENFNRTWYEYKNGFGNVSKEFFIGLEKLHRMTEARPHELYIKLGNINGSTSYARYDDFKIGSEEEAYELKNLGKYSGEAGDSLEYDKNEKFSTFDRDNDSYMDYNCANEYGAWWHKYCSESSLNGNYKKDGKGLKGIHWHSWHEDWKTSLTFVEIMIRPKSFS
uniref:Fibrinogen-like protein A n=1 Tax=Drosophila rhopaloa TaxID=1041015 RepID=A0A6P4EBX2_DRORH